METPFPVYPCTCNYLAASPVYSLKTLPVGTRLRVGACLLAVTQIGKECHNDGCAIQKATGCCVMPTEGIFAIVLEGGVIRKGDGIAVEGGAAAG